MSHRARWSSQSYSPKVWNISNRDHRKSQVISSSISTWTLDNFLSFPCKHVWQQTFGRSPNTPWTWSCMSFFHIDMSRGNSGFLIKMCRELGIKCSLVQIILCYEALWMLFAGDEDFVANSWSIDWIPTIFSLSMTLYSYKLLKFFWTSYISISETSFNSAEQSNKIAWTMRSWPGKKRWGKISSLLI